MPDSARGEDAPRSAGHSEEAARIAAEYERRSREIPTSRYEVTLPGPLFVRQSTERAIVRALASSGILPLSGRPILEIGCGDGSWLVSFEAWGADRRHLAGIDLLDDRVERARERLSGVEAADVRSGDATNLPWKDESFEIVFQSMMLSSIVDGGVRRAVAEEARRVLRPGGLVISYDFCFDNPRNHRVRKVRKREFEELFPGFVVRASRPVLAPPVARKLAPISWPATEVLQATTLLNSQMLATIRQEPANA